MNTLFMPLTVLFTSLLGEVHSEDVVNSLKLMGLGMLGILIVMVLIWIVIAVLNRTGSGKDKAK